MTERPIDERRESARTKSRPPFDVKLLSAKTVSCLAYDVSPGGMLLEVEGALPRVGSEVQVKFQLPGATRRLVANAAVVRHAGPKLIGVRFLRLSTDELALIRGYVDAG